MSDTQEMNGAGQPETVEEQQTIPLETADQVVYHMASWHNNRMGQLVHAMNVPPEIPVEVTDHKTGEVIVLNEEQMVGFRAGLSIAVSIFKQFPIQMIPAEQAEEPAALEMQTPEEGHDQSN